MTGSDRNARGGWESQDRTPVSSRKAHDPNSSEALLSQLRDLQIKAATLRAKAPDSESTLGAHVTAPPGTARGPAREAGNPVHDASRGRIARVSSAYTNSKPGKDALDMSTVHEQLSLLLAQTCLLLRRMESAINPPAQSGTMAWKTVKKAACTIQKRWRSHQVRKGGALLLEFAGPQGVGGQDYATAVGDIVKIQAAYRGARERRKVLLCPDVTLTSEQMLLSTARRPDLHYADSFLSLPDSPMSRSESKEAGWDGGLGMEVTDIDNTSPAVEDAAQATDTTPKKAAKRRIRGCCGAKPKEAGQRKRRSETKVAQGGTPSPESTSQASEDFAPPARTPLTEQSPNSFSPMVLLDNESYDSVGRDRQSPPPSPHPSLAETQRGDADPYSTTPPEDSPAPSPRSSIKGGFKGAASRETGKRLSFSRQAEKSLPEPRRRTRRLAAVKKLQSEDYGAKSAKKASFFEDPGDNGVGV